MDEQTNGPESGWDTAVEQAWVKFRGRLADRLGELAEDQSLLVALPDDDLEGAAAYCQVMAYGPGRLRLEAVSNAFLDPAHALDDAQEQQLLGLGLTAPSEDESPNFWLDLEVREADRAAWVLVEALRRVHGVLHPVYLDAEGLEPAGPSDPSDAADPAGAAGDGPVIEGDGPWTPRDRDDVRAMLRHCATELVEGGEAELDDDGDLSIGAGDCVLWVTAARGTARILLSAVLAVDVVDEQRALVEVNLLNRREFGLTFLLQDGRVTVRRELPVGVFVGWEVRGEMERILADVERWSREMVVRVGGRAPGDAGPVRLPGHERAAPDPAGGDRLSAALDVLAELARADRDGLTPQLLADVFHGDRALVMGAIRDSREREEDAVRRARKAEKQGRARMSRLWRAKARHHREVRGLLRQALRLVVQRSGRDQAPQPEQLSLFGEDEVTR